MENLIDPYLWTWPLNNPEDLSCVVQNYINVNSSGNVPSTYYPSTNGFGGYRNNNSCGWEMNSAMQQASVPNYYTNNMLPAPAHQNASMFDSGLPPVGNVQTAVCTYSTNVVPVPYNTDHHIPSAEVTTDNSGSSGESEDKDPKSDTKKHNKGEPWTEGEHRLFLKGLKAYGKGKWKLIAKNFVKTRDSTQVASHAQKYMNKLNLNAKRKRRRNKLSIFEKTWPSTDNLPELLRSQELIKEQPTTTTTTTLTNVAEAETNHEEIHESMFGDDSFDLLAFPPLEDDFFDLASLTFEPSDCSFDRVFEV